MKYFCIIYFNLYSLYSLAYDFRSNIIYFTDINRIKQLDLKTSNKKKINKYK